jgi:hypothetical protein
MLGHGLIRNTRIRCKLTLDTDESVYAVLKRRSGFRMCLRDNRTSVQISGLMVPGGRMDKPTIARLTNLICLDCLWPTLIPSNRHVGDSYSS